MTAMKEAEPTPAEWSVAPVGTIARRNEPFTNCLVKTTYCTWGGIWWRLDKDEIQAAIRNELNTLSPGPSGPGWEVIYPREDHQ